MIELYWRKCHSSIENYTYFNEGKCFYESNRKKIANCKRVATPLNAVCTIFKYGCKIFLWQITFFNWNINHCSTLQFWHYFALYTIYTTPIIFLHQKIISIFMRILLLHKSRSILSTAQCNTDDKIIMVTTLFLFDSGTFKCQFEKAILLPIFQKLRNKNNADIGIVT